MNEVKSHHNEVQVWWASLAVDASLLDRLRRLLSPAEQRRADRIRIEQAEGRFVAARAALRLVLGYATGIEPAEIDFRFGEHGKPYLPGGAPCFNASDSGDLVAIAVSTSEVGIDIEGLRAFNRSDRLARRICTPKELDGLAKLAEEDRDRRLLRLWTCKEAGLKAVGVGLPGGARNVEVELPINGSPTLTNLLGETTGWTLLCPDVDQEMLCSLVIRGENWRAVRRPFSLHST